MAARYHHGDLAGALIDAAISILESDGLAALSLRECARRAGVSHAAPAHHFADLRSLQSAVAAIGFERKSALMQAARDAAGDDPRQALAGVGRAYIRFALAHPGLFGLMHRCDMLDQTQPALHAASAAARDHLIETLLAAGCAADGTVPSDLGARATLAWSAVHGFAQLAIDGAFDTVASGSSAPDDVAVEALLQPMIEILLPALTSERAATAPRSRPRRR